MHQKIKNSYQVKKEYWKQGKDAQATAQALQISLGSVYRHLGGVRNVAKRKRELGKKRVQSAKRSSKTMAVTSME